MKQIHKRLTYANVMSTIAVFLILGGATAIAAGLGKNSVGSKQIKKNAVTAAKIKDSAVNGAKLAPGTVTSDKIVNDAVTGDKIKESTLSQVPSAATAIKAETATTATTATTAKTATTATTASNVNGQATTKIFRTLSAGQNDVEIANIAGFVFTADCEAGDAGLTVDGPTDPGFAMEAGGTPAIGSDVTTGAYEGSKPGEGGDIEIDRLTAGGDATYGVSSFSATTTTGTVISGVLGYDYGTFNQVPPNTCVFYGHLLVG